MQQRLSARLGAPSCTEYWELMVVLGDIFVCECDAQLPWPQEIRAVPELGEAEQEQLGELERFTNEVCGDITASTQSFVLLRKMLVAG